MRVCQPCTGEAFLPGSLAKLIWRSAGLGCGWISCCDAHSVSPRSSLIPLAEPRPVHAHPCPVLPVQAWKRCLSLEGCVLASRRGRRMQGLFQRTSPAYFLGGKGLLHRASLLSLLLRKQSGLLKAALSNLR